MSMPQFLLKLIDHEMLLAMNGRFTVLHDEKGEASLM